MLCNLQETKLEASEPWELNLLPVTPAAQLVARAAATLLDATPSLASRPADLATAMSAQLPRNFTTAVRRTMPTPRPSAKPDPTHSLRNLRHEFVIVRPASGEELIVEPRFSSHFELPRASSHYAASLSLLPSLVVLGRESLRAAVTELVRHGAAEYVTLGEPLPPWRTLAGQLSKWLAADVEDTHVARPLAPLPAPAAPSFSRVSVDSFASDSSDSEVELFGSSPDTVLPMLTPVFGFKAKAAASSVLPPAPSSSAPLVRVQGFNAPSVSGFSIQAVAPTAANAVADALLPRVHVVRRVGTGKV